MRLLWYIVIFLYILYFFLYTYCAHYFFRKIIPAYEKMSKEDKDKYFMFDRPEIPKISMFSTLLCGYTVGFIRFVGFWLVLVIFYIGLRIIFICYDPETPLSRCRSSLVKIWSFVMYRILLFLMGFFWIQNIEKRI